MDKFEDAFKKISKVNLATHIELWGKPKTEKLYFEAGWQSRQSEFDAMTEAFLNQTQLLAKQKVEVEEKDKRITELEKSEFELAKVKQILNKHIKTRLLESIIVRELIDLLFSNKG